MYLYFYTCDNLKHHTCITGVTQLALYPNQLGIITKSRTIVQGKRGVTDNYSRRGKLTINKK